MALTPADHSRAKSVLDAALIGRSICGLHFYGTPGGVPILLFDNPERPHPNEAWLTIESSWKTSDIDVWDGASRSLDELAAFAVSRRHKSVRSISLGVSAPHLLLAFDDGGYLHLHGSNARYESWNLTCGEISVIALPGDRIWSDG
jgi:hypothetical protein